MDEMATSLQTIKHCEEQNSALIISTRSEFKEFTQKVSDVEKNLEVLECKVLKIEKQVSYSENNTTRSKGYSPLKTETTCPTSSLTGFIVFSNARKHDLR